MRWDSIAETGLWHWMLNQGSVNVLETSQLRSIEVTNV